MMTIAIVSMEIRGFFSLKNGILLPKLFCPTVRKKCSSDLEKHLRYEAEGREFSNFLRLLDQFIQTVKGHNNFLVTECFF